MRQHHYTAQLLRHFGQQCGIQILPNGLGRLALGRCKGVAEPFDQGATLVIEKTDILPRGGMLLGVEAALNHYGGLGPLIKNRHQA